MWQLCLRHCSVTEQKIFMFYITGLSGLVIGGYIIKRQICVIPISIQLHIIPDMIHGSAFTVINFNTCFFQQGGIGKGIPLADTDSIYQRFVCIPLFKPRIIVCTLVINHVLYQIIMQRQGFLFIGHIIINNLGKHLVYGSLVFGNAVLGVLCIIGKGTFCNKLCGFVCKVSIIEYIKEIRIILGYIWPDKRHIRLSQLVTG